MKIAFSYTDDLKIIKKFISLGKDAVIHEIQGTTATFCLVYVRPAVAKKIIGRIGWIKIAPLDKKIPCFHASNIGSDVYLTLKFSCLDPSFLPPNPVYHHFPPFSSNQTCN